MIRPINFLKTFPVRYQWLALLSLIASSHIAQTASATGLINSQQHRFKIETLAEGFNIPWAMVFIDDRQLLITEKQGSAKLLNTATGSITAITGLPNVHAQGQGGLLDVAIAADFKAGDWIYFTYSKPDNEGSTTALARSKLKGHQLQDWQTLLVTQASSSATRHFGSRIAFDGKGHVFFSVGDRGDRPNGQDLKTHAGSILRLNLDGSVPADNPFVNESDALPEIWSYGHRNPQGLAFDHINNRLWAIEHGPRGGDELNLIVAGNNYGWSVVSHGKEYWGPISVGESTSKSGMTDPVKVYVPSIAPGSLLLYQGKAFPDWQGNLFAGALVLRHLNRIVINEQGQAVAEERLLAAMEERIRALASDSAGNLYLSTDSGKILRITPATN